MFIYLSHKLMMPLKYCMFILGALVLCYVLYQNAKSNYLKKDYCNKIDKAISAGEKYRNEPSDKNRIEFIKALR